MTQSLSIGLFLILINRKKKNALTYLGFFLMSLGLISFSETLELLNVDNTNSYLSLPFYFTWSTPILLYLYVEQISILPKHKHSNYLLVFGVIELILGFVFYFSPLNLRKELEDSLFFELFQVIGFLFGLYLFVKIFIRVRKHSKLLKKQYSSIEGRDLNWINQFIIFNVIVFIGVLPASFYFLSEFVTEVAFSIFSLLVTFWISYHGLSQLLSTDLIKELAIKNNQVIDTKENSSKDSETLEKYKSVLQKIDQEIEQSELFLNPELTIVQIAECVNEHPRLISKTINTLKSENFNTYINSFRVAKAKEMLLNGASDQLNIEGIGKEVGFKSNSSFYAAFKKQMNCTPLKFVKVHN